ncbi:hypothetical protein PR048_009736 [Dryococelus australis]|uniref:Uncharacterized protein n=1 Tax=Dryococelus australis TaxID=614101 RepID=A0ABQ9I2K4_9NEOP|nr:hypothetical protein PR048_009736 [Dryococelus australis]
MYQFITSEQAEPGRAHVSFDEQRRALSRSAISAPSRRSPSHSSWVAALCSVGQQYIRFIQPNRQALLHRMSANACRRDLGRGPYSGRKPKGKDSFEDAADVWRYPRHKQLVHTRVAIILFSLAFIVGRRTGSLGYRRRFPVTGGNSTRTQETACKRDGAIWANMIACVEYGTFWSTNLEGLPVTATVLSSRHEECIGLRRGMLYVCLLRLQDGALPGVWRVVDLGDVRHEHRLASSPSVVCIVSTAAVTGAQLGASCTGPAFDSRTGHPDFGSPSFSSITLGECEDCSLRETEQESGVPRRSLVSGRSTFSFSRGSPLVAGSCCVRRATTISASTSRGTTLKEARVYLLQMPGSLYADQALLLMVDTSLSTRQYPRILKEAKELCYHQGIFATEISAEIPLQSLLTTQLLTLVKEVRERDRDRERERERERGERERERERECMFLNMPISRNLEMGIFIVVKTILKYYFEKPCAFFHNVLSPYQTYVCERICLFS